jgi:hypothetical protein
MVLRSLVLLLISPSSWLSIFAFIPPAGLCVQLEHFGLKYCADREGHAAAGFLAGVGGQ